MDLINDIDAVFADRRCKICLFPQLAYIFNAVVAGGVNFRNVEQRTLLNPCTGGAFQARRAVFLRVLAVDCHGKNFGAGSFTRSAGTGKEIGMTHPAGF